MFCMLQPSRVCTSCRKEKPLDSFETSIKKEGKISRSRKCRQCRAMSRNKNRAGEPAKYLKLIFSQLKYSRKKDNPELPWEIEKEDLLALWEEQSGKCAISGILMTTAKDGSGKKEFNASLDRINPDFGYNKENIQLVCHRVNLMKHTMSADMLLWWCKNIVLNNP